MKDIIIFLPAGHDRPTGGVKIVYEYANRLSDDGYHVSIVYIVDTLKKSKSVIEHLKTILRYIYSLWRTSFAKCSWFPLSKKIHESTIYKLNKKFKPKDNEFNILTSVSTALNFYQVVTEYNPNNLLYFIQDYECWDVDEEELLFTYKKECKKIVIAQWLKDKIYLKANSLSNFVPNGFDFNQFRLTIPIKNKNKYCISFLYHHRVVKDTATGLRALEYVKQQIPQIHVLMFGTYDLIDSIPCWIKYYKNPTLHKHIEINNTAAIYLGTSKEEGWGLTIGEAMMCGQAVVCTDNLGYKEMAIHEENALISHIEDPKSLADNIIRLITDDDLRYKLSENGYKHIQKFSIEDSYIRFKQIIEE